MPSADLESSSCLPHMNNNMPWGWILEYLLDVKQLSPLFFKDIIGYVPPIEQPQCSRLLQKVALRYLDEVTLTREFDTCDVLLVRFLLKEQGVSDLCCRIHSLKESFAHDLTLRVETEAVLTNLRSYWKDGRRDDWAAFEDAVDNVFSEEILKARGIERRKELTAVLPDRSNGEPEKDLREQLLGKYPLEGLCKDLARFVDDKKKVCKIKFVDQLAEDVENGVYSFSPGSCSHETWSPSNMHTDFCDNYQVQEFLLTRKDRSIRKTSHHPSRDWPRIGRPLKEGDLTCKAKDRDTDPHYRVSGVNVSEPKDVRAEMSCRMAEVDKVANGFTNEIFELVNDITKFTEDVHNTASIPFSTPDLGNQQISSLPAPTAGNPASTQDNFVAIFPAKRADFDLEIDKPVDDHSENPKSLDYHRSESLKNRREGGTLSQPTSYRISPKKLRKRFAVETVDQVAGVAKKRKFDDEEDLSGEQRNLSGARWANIEFRFRPMVQKHFGEGPSKVSLSTKNEDNAVRRVNGNCDMIDKQVGKCCSGICPCRASKHTLISHTEPGLTSSDLNLRAAGGGDGGLNAKCHFCGSSGGCQVLCHRCSMSIHKCCLSKLSQEKLGYCLYCFASAATMAQEALRKAEDGVKRAKEAVSKAEEDVLTTQARLATFLSARREQPKVENVFVDFNRETLVVKVTETSQESIKSLHAEQGSSEDYWSDPEEEDRALLARSGIITATRVPLYRSTLQNAIIEDTIRNVCETGEEIKMQTARQAPVLGEELRAATGNHVPSTASPIITSANDSSHTKSCPRDVFSEDIGAYNGSEVSMSHRGDLGPSSGSLSIRRSPEREECDGHDGDLEEVCEGNIAAEKAVGLVSVRISEPSNIGAKSRCRQVYRGRISIPGVRRQSLPWTGIEEDVLKEGVNMFSNSGEWGFQWRRILEFGHGKFHESRTTVDLKDKWRNMVKGRRLSDQSS